jgi:hypothetical protein
MRTAKQRPSKTEDVPRKLIPLRHLRDLDQALDSPGVAS